MTMTIDNDTTPMSWVQVEYCIYQWLCYIQFSSLFDTLLSLFPQKQYDLFSWLILVARFIILMMVLFNDLQKKRLLMHSIIVGILV